MTRRPAAVSPKSAYLCLLLGHIDDKLLCLPPNRSDSLLHGDDNAYD